VDADSSTSDHPVLFVANHGFGGIFDLNVFATGAALEQPQLDRHFAAEGGADHRRPCRVA